MKKYKLSFLPLFEQDLNEIVDYITANLQNPSAAERLVDDIEAAVYKRLETPWHLLRSVPQRNGRTHITESTSETFPFSTLSSTTQWKCVAFCIPSEIWINCSMTNPSIRVNRMGVFQSGLFINEKIRQTNFHIFSQKKNGCHRNGLNTGFFSPLLFCS